MILFHSSADDTDAAKFRPMLSTYGLLLEKYDQYGLWVE